jgi:hypothetical protein
MNRQQVLEAYTVDEKSGVIKSPGKFEGEMLYVPALWEQAMSGSSDFDEASVFGMVFDDADRKEFPEIGETYGIFLEESEQGFVNTEEFDTKEEYDAAAERVAREGGDEDNS